MKRRITAWVAALVLIVSLLPVSAFAVDTPSLSVSDSVLHANDTFTVKLEIPAIAKKAGAASFMVTFDKDNFEVTEFVAPTLDGGTLAAPNLSEANAAGAFSCGYISTENTIDLTAGVTVQATFKVKDTAAAGEYTFAVDGYHTKVVEVGDDGITETDLIDNLGILSIVVNVMGSTPSHTHVWDTAWNHDDNYHWHDCTAAACNVADNAKKDGYGAHVYNQEVVSEQYLASKATCTAPATYYKTCSVCGAKGTETFTYGDAQGHDYGTLHAAKAATCTEDGNMAYYQCSRCSKYFDENKGKIETPTIDKLGHDIQHHPYVAATCMKTGSNEYWSCKRCDGKFADEKGNTQFTSDIVIPVNDKNHGPSDTWTWAGDNEEHWKICPDCKAIMSITVDHHTPSSTGEATCVGNATCDVCKKSFGEKNPNNHASTLEHHDAVDATCVSKGNIEYWSCASCEKNFSNAAGTTAISDADLVVAVNPNNHTGTLEWVTTATTHQQKYSCCGKVEVAEAAHDWSANDGVCTVCGYKCGHSQANKWDANENEHWQRCDTCGYKRNRNVHQVGTPANCKSGAICSACAHPYGEKNPNNHVNAEAEWIRGENTHEKKWKCCDLLVVKEEPHTWKDGVCSECGWKCEHKGGTATCKEKATCSICGQQYGNLAAHTLTKTEATAATCTENGNIAYWTCSVCKKLFSDENGTTVVTLEKTVIPALGHDWAAAWSTDGNNHWHECTRCHDKKDVAAHTGGTATCQHKAKCDTCGVEYGDLAAHKLTLTAAKAPTCLEPGNHAYYTCSVCGKVFKDADGTQATTVADETLAKLTTHTRSANPVINGNEHYWFCTVCGTVLEKVTHDIKTDAETGRTACGHCHYVLGGAVILEHQHKAGTLACDETNHWYNCAGENGQTCDEHMNTAAHDYGTETTVTEGSTTITVKKCQTCGYVKRTETTNTTPVNPGGNTSGGSKPSGRNDGKTVESGKTFDAGIGVYVGLSILSMTGSAVVIGKKRKTR